MPLRTFRFPADFRVAAERIPLAFQYPESETWGVQSDEKESLIDLLNTLERLWPLIWLIQLASPALRDILRGYVWEEDKQPVGTVKFNRWGTTNIWYITTVAVLPSYRRRGIGRKLVQAALNDIREHGGEVALLDVIAGNVPAYTLYERLGFERFTGSIKFNYNQNGLPPELSLPHGYTVSPLDFLDWHADHQLAQRIIPANVQRYEPAEGDRFRRPQVVRPLMPIIRRAIGMREGKFAIRTVSDGQIVALAEYAARIRPGGLNYINMRIDPAHAELTSYLVQNLIRTMQRLSPGRRIEFIIPQWQDRVIEAANAGGCVKRLEYHRMGMIL